MLSGDSELQKIWEFAVAISAVLFSGFSLPCLAQGVVHSFTPLLYLTKYVLSKEENTILTDLGDGEGI